MSTQKVTVNLPEEMVEFLQHTAKKAIVNIHGYFA